MIFNFAPSTPAKTLLNWTVSSPGPVPPINSSLCNRSSKVVIPTVCQATHTLTSSLALPIPAEFRAVELGARLPEQGIKRGAAADGAECGPIFRSHVVKPVGQADAGRTLHVLRHHGRVAGQISADVASQQSRIEVVTASDRVSGVDIDSLSFENRRRILREGTDRQQHRNGANNRSQRAQRATHFVPPRDSEERGKKGGTDQPRASSCPRLSRASTSFLPSMSKQGVGGRNKSGHDGSEWTCRLP